MVLGTDFNLYVFITSLNASILLNSCSFIMFLQIEDGDGSKDENGNDNRSTNFWSQIHDYVSSSVYIYSWCNVVYKVDSFLVWQYTTCLHT